MATTGDLQGNITRLQSDLKKLKYPAALDAHGCAQGDPAAFLPPLHYALLGYSRLVARNLNARGYELQAKSDQRFVEGVIRMLREEFKYLSALTPKNFLSQGYAERKCLLVHDVIGLVSKRHEELARQDRVKTADGNLRSSLLSAFPKRRDPRRPASAPPAPRAVSASKTAAAIAAAKRLATGSPPAQPSSRPGRSHVHVEVLRGSQVKTRVARARPVGLPRDGAVLVEETPPPRPGHPHPAGISSSSEGGGRRGGGDAAGPRPPAAKRPAAPSAPPAGLGLLPRPALPEPGAPPGPAAEEAATAPPAEDVAASGAWASLGAAGEPCTGHELTWRGDLDGDDALDPSSSYSSAPRASVHIHVPRGATWGRVQEAAWEEEEEEGEAGEDGGVTRGLVEELAGRMEAAAEAAARREGALMERLAAAEREAARREERLQARVVLLESRLRMLEDSPPAYPSSASHAARRAAASPPAPPPPAPASPHPSSSPDTPSPPPHTASTATTTTPSAIFQPPYLSPGLYSFSPAVAATAACGTTTVVGVSSGEVLGGGGAHRGLEGVVGGAGTAEFLARVAGRFEAARQMLQAA